MAESLVNTEYLRSEIKRQFGTQSAFARHMGWSRQYLSQVLNGKVNITFSQYNSLKSALEVYPPHTAPKSELRMMKESMATYSTNRGDHVLATSSPSILVANQAQMSSPVLDIGSLRRWSSGDPNVKRLDTPQERIAFIRSLQEHYRDILPSTETIRQYKQEEKELEERQHASRA